MFQEIINAINKTGENHPEYSMINHTYFCLNSYYKTLVKTNDPLSALDIFYKGISRLDKNNNPLRNKLMSYMADNDKDCVLEFFKMIYSYSLRVIEFNKTKRGNVELLRFSYYYVAAYNNLCKGKDIEIYRNIIYSNPKSLSSLMNLVEPILEYFIPAIAPKTSNTSKELKSGIIFSEITNTADKVFTNVKDKKILDSFGAKLNNGKIQVASHIGKKPRQEDAVLSISNGNYYMNVVADGMGGSDDGQIASMMTIKELAKWFTNLDFSMVPIDYNGVQNSENNPLFKMISNKLQEINDKINRSYSNGPGTTVVLSFSTPDYTQIVSVGDSTAYLKDGNNIRLLTKIDASKTISQNVLYNYEKYRNIYNNNEVSGYLGCGARVIRPHGCSIDHKVNRKILLSSDGVTDLINEENFKKLFLGNATAVDFINKALNPDPHTKPKDGSYERLSKKQSDNISAILIDIPSNGRKL